MGRPKTVYRGKRKYGWLITLVLFILIFALMAAVWLFYYLQKYIVYDKDGLSLVLPFMEDDSGPAASQAPDVVLADPVDADIVVELPDFSDMEPMAGEGLENMKAQYVAAENVSASNLRYCAALLNERGADTLVLQMKTAEGTLSYASGIALATGYGVNGTENLYECLDGLKEDGVYLVAEISCLVDNAMAERNAPLALKDAGTGAVLTDASGAWLDPYNDGTREYLFQLLAELAGMGFDEVLLTGLAYPRSDRVAFSQSMTAQPDPVSCVSSLSLYLREEADGLGLRLSVMADSAALRAGESVSVGQDLSFLFKVFDRVYVQTEYDYFNADLSALQSALGSTDGTRIVPVTTGYVPESSSWAAR